MEDNNLQYSNNNNPYTGGFMYSIFQPLLLHFDCFMNVTLPCIYYNDFKILYIIGYSTYHVVCHALITLIQPSKPVYVCNSYVSQQNETHFQSLCIIGLRDHAYISPSLMHRPFPGKAQTLSREQRTIVPAFRNTPHPSLEIYD